MSQAAKLRELIGVIKRFAELEELRGETSTPYSAHGAHARPTGKCGNPFLRAQDVTTEIIGNIVKRALSSRVGLRREYAVDALASLINVDTKTIQNYMAGQAPSSQNLFRLIAFFGPEFATELFAPMGLTVVESESAYAAQSLSIEHLTSVLPELKHQLLMLEQALDGQGFEAPGDEHA